MSTLTKPSPLSTDKIWTRDFVLICVANFFIFLGFQMTLPTIPLFVTHLGGSERLIGVVVGIFTFSALLLRPLAGKLLESKGRRFVFLVGLIIYVISVGSFGFMGSMVFLFAMRIVQGAGWGFSSTASGTIATDLIPAKRRGEGMGYYSLSGNLALAMGPSLGLLLVGAVSFKVLFLISAGLGLAAFLIATALRYTEVEKGAVKTTTIKFDFYEKTALPPSILLLFITVTFGGIATFLPLYAAQKGVSGIQWYFLIYALSLMSTRLFAGKLYDKHGHKFVFIPSVFLMIIAMLLLAWLPSNTVLYIAAICYGFGFGSVSPALQAWSMEKAARNRKGMANATFFSFFDLGVGIGAIVFGQIAYMYGYASIYWTAAGSVFLSLLFYLYILTKEHKQGSAH